MKRGKLELLISPIYAISIGASGITKIISISAIPYSQLKPILATLIKKELITTYIPAKLESGNWNNQHYVNYKITAKGKQALKLYLELIDLINTDKL